MLQLISEGNFLKATLNEELSVEIGSFTLKSGVKINVLDRGIIEIVPRKESVDALIVSSGIHGDETAPIEVVSELLNSIIQEKIIPSKNLLLIVAHPKATNQHVREIDINLNRLFSGKEQGQSIEHKIAENLKSKVEYFFKKKTYVNKIHLDLHSAIRKSKYFGFGVSPSCTGNVRKPEFFAFLAQTKLGTITLSDIPSSTFSWYTGEFYESQSITLELGKVAKFGENDHKLLQPTFDAISDLISIDGYKDTEFDKSDIDIYKSTRTLFKKTNDFHFTFDAGVPNFTFFEKGIHLASDNGQEYYAAEGGEAVVFPNPNVQIGHRTCMLMQPTQIKIVNNQVMKS